MHTLRRVALVLLALMSLSGAMVATAVPAAATGGACGGLSWFDTPGLSYPNSDYKAANGGNFTDASQGITTHISFDIQSWRLTGTNAVGGGFTAGHCYRRVRFSVWIPDNTTANLWMHVRVWANQNGYCTQLVYDIWTPGVTGTSTEWYSSWYDYSGCGGPNADGWGFASGFYFYPSPVPYAYAGLP